jgi:lysophospholipase L1-like esterase
MRKRIVLLLFTTFVIIISANVNATEFKKTFSGFHPVDGDTIVFLGDSITHQCLYTQYVEDYFYTRYPAVKLIFRNAGVSADKAEQTLERFQEDVARSGPRYVTVLIGMNDGQYTYFKHSIFNTYKRDMTKLLDKIEGIGATAIAITPTMYDLRQALKGKNWVPVQQAESAHYNAVLAFLGAWVREEANRRGIGFVDMYEPLNRFTRQQRKTNPHFTFMEDAVHPEPDGHLVMALALLTALDADPVVSNILIQPKNGKWTGSAEKGTLKPSSFKTINFTFKADCLPWVVPAEAAGGFKLTGAGGKMSRETFRVVGLEPGNYRLLIDNGSVGIYSHLQLAAGVELQENTKTPQYRQALKVAWMNKKRNDEAVRPLRHLWEQRKWKKFGRDWTGQEIAPLNPEAFKKWELEFKKKAAHLEKKAADLAVTIYRINQPKPHKYELKRVN